MSLQPSSGSWNLLLLAWLVALVSTLSALFIGEVMGLRISEHRDRPFRLIVTAHFANA